jgi:PAS domain S-box-containing protein
MAWTFIRLDLADTAAPACPWLGLAAVALLAMVVWAIWLLFGRSRARRMAEDLRRSEERFRLVAEHAPGVVYLCRNDPRWTMLYLNEAIEPLTGHSRADFLADRIGYADVIHPDDRPRVYQEVQAAVALRQPFHIVYRVCQRGGQVRWVEERGSAICRPEGLVEMLAGHIVDVTDRRHAEEDRIELERSALHAQKLESLGVLAGGIAHDFNNLLMVMMGNVELALQDIPEQSPARQHLQRADQAARHATLLTRQMLAYAGKGKVAVRRVDLNALLDDMAHLLRTTIPKSIELAEQLHRPLPPIEADPAQLQQLVMNLLTNAAEAVGDKPGTVTVSTGLQECGVDYLAQSRVEPPPAPGSFVYLMVADTGCGMSSETQQRMFDPFFTTKFTGRGLGLASVMGVTRAHKGAIILHSEEGRGTTIKILFPVVNLASTAEPGVAQAEPEPVDHAPFSGTVLVADDEPTVRHTAKLMLERLGFTVLTAADGEEAVDLYRKRSHDIALVLLDLTMPRMDGPTAFAEIIRLRPDARILLTSGYAQQSVMGRFTGVAPAGFIGKPYQLKRLRQELRRVLGPSR